MVAALKSPRFTPQEYFDWEDQQQERYEYFDGEVYAMAGGSIAHGLIGLNITTSLRPHVRAMGCKTYNSDCKVGISKDGPFSYPDVSVSCDKSDQTAQKFISSPCLIIEVLSPNTEAYDRGGKFHLYSRIASLKEYVLVGSETKSVEIFRRNPSGSWEFTLYGAGDTFTLTSIDFTIAVEAFYEDVIVVPKKKKSL